MATSSCPRCGIPGKASSMFACRTCWFALSSSVRNAISRAYRRDGALSDEWVAAAREAFEEWGMEIPRWLAVLEGD